MPKDGAIIFGDLILAETNLERFSQFVWQKQTSKMMLGRYPDPGNIIENNTIEFINVYVKPGKPPKFDPDVKELPEPSGSTSPSRSGSCTRKT